MDTTGTWPFGRRLEDQVATRFLSVFLDMEAQFKGQEIQRRNHERSGGVGRPADGAEDAAQSAEERQKGNSLNRFPIPGGAVVTEKTDYQAELGIEKDIDELSDHRTGSADRYREGRSNTKTASIAHAVHTGNPRQPGSRSPGESTKA